jgi:hypothetical protein
MSTVVKTVKVPKAVALALSRVAKARGCSESEVIRQGIMKIAGEADGLDMQALLAADVGVGSGAADLSSSRKHLAGYGRSRRR